MRRQDIHAREQGAEMSCVPSDDTWDIADNRGLTDQRVVAPRPDTTTAGKSTHDVERLRRCQTDKSRNGAQALDCRPGFIGCEAKRSAITTASEGVIRFRVGHGLFQAEKPRAAGHETGAGRLLQGAHHTSRRQLRLS
jgi:hypothetical protein